LEIGEVSDGRLQFAVGKWFRKAFEIWRKENILEIYNYLPKKKPEVYNSAISKPCFNVLKSFGKIINFSFGEPTYAIAFIEN